MTQINIINTINCPKIKHISEMVDGEYGLIYQSGSFSHCVGELIQRLDYKTTYNFSVINFIKSNTYYTLDEDIYCIPVEELEIRIVK